MLPTSWPALAFLLVCCSLTAFSHFQKTPLMFRGERLAGECNTHPRGTPLVSWGYVMDDHFGSCYF